MSVVDTEHVSRKATFVCPQNVVLEGALQQRVDVLAIRRLHA
jgi:hypothetical protein